MSPEQIKLVNILQRFFRKPVDASLPLLYTTNQLFEKLQSVYPTDAYTHEDVYEVMIYLDIEFINSSAGPIQWLLQEVPQD